MKGILLAALAAGLWAPPGRAAATYTVEIHRFTAEEALRVLPEFRVALYENLIEALTNKGKFVVLREGQLKEAQPGVIAVRCSVMEFKKGSERLRQVTTVAGATSITVRVRLEDRATGALVAEKSLTGKVRFLGGNLRATLSLAKQVARLLEQSLAGQAGAE